MICRTSGNWIRSEFSFQNSPTEQAVKLGAAKCQELLVDLAVTEKPMRVYVPLLEFNQSPL